MYEEAKNRIRWLYDEFDEVIVFVSGGKDSEVIMHLTHEIAEERGKTPVVVSGMSAKQAKEYRISDNKIQEETDWDEDLLKSEMREFEEVIGFSTEELQKILDKEENEVVKAYEQDDFQKTADNFATHHANVVEGAEDSIVQVVCPHCAGEFGVNKDNFKNNNPNGCGTGLAYSLLSPEQRSRYVGVDLEEGVIQRAQEKHPRGVFVQGSAQELLTSERFKTIDNLISLFAIDYIGEETMKALIQRTTGRVMFTLFNQPHLPGSSSFYQGKKSFYQERHGQNNQRIRNTLQQEGFIIRPLLQQPYHDIVTNHYNINTEDISRYRGTRT